MHASLVEWLADPNRSLEYHASRRQGTRRLAAVARQWEELRDEASRKYVVRQAAHHILDDEKAAGPSDVLALCATSNGAFLDTAVALGEAHAVGAGLRRTAGVAFLKDQPSAGRRCADAGGCPAVTTAPDRAILDAIASNHDVATARLLSEVDRIDQPLRNGPWPSSLWCGAMPATTRRASRDSSTTWGPCTGRQSSRVWPISRPGCSRPRWPPCHRKWQSDSSRASSRPTNAWHSRCRRGSGLGVRAPALREHLRSALRHFRSLESVPVPHALQGLVNAALRSATTSCFSKP